MWQVWSVTAQRSVTKSVTQWKSEWPLLWVWQIWIICRYPVSILLLHVLSSVWPWVRLGHSCTDRHGARANTFSSSSLESAGCCVHHICCAQHHIRDWEVRGVSREKLIVQMKSWKQRVSLKKNSVRKTSPARLYYKWVQNTKRKRHFTLVKIFVRKFYWWNSDNWQSVITGLDHQDDIGDHQLCHESCHDASSTRLRYVSIIVCDTPPHIVSYHSAPSR